MIGVRIGLGSNLAAAVAKATGNRQSFVYTATGAETDTFTLTLEAARPTTNYGAAVTGLGLTDQLTFDVVASGNTLTTISVKSSGALTAGDKLLVTVQDLT